MNLRHIAPLGPLSFRELRPASLKGQVKPRILWVKPTDLMVDADYQRNLSERSVTLIRKLWAEWSYRKYKPPVVARIPQGLVVIDGQHTAIAAASHPELDLIPVMVVDAPTTEDQAAAFLGHNRDRLAVTVGQMHFAGLAAGDATAVKVQRVADAAGLTILRSSQHRKHYKAGQTVALRAVEGLIKRHGEEAAIDIVKVAVDGKMAPVAERHLLAIEHLLHDGDYALSRLRPAAITTAILAIGPKLDDESKLNAATYKVPQWKAMALVLDRKARRAKRAA